MDDSAGVHNPSKIDLVTLSPTGRIILVMIDERPWEGRSDRLQQLQDKINTYLSFVLDGELLRRYPEAKGRAVDFRLDVAHEPDQQVLRFLDAARDQLSRDGISISVNVR